METENTISKEFLPKYESARIAVERARQIVKDNNEMVAKLKSESNIPEETEGFDLFMSVENFSHHDSYAFDLYKIKSSNSVRDFIKDIFGVH